jgi:HEAT repeat protein
MRISEFLLRRVICLTAVLGLCRFAPAADNSGDELVGMISNLVSDKDKDIRALGLQQVREEAKGAVATKQFAALLPKLPSDAQTGLVDALADRGDNTARPAVLEMLKSREEPVRVAALRALGALGKAADVPLLVQTLASGTESETTAARASLARMPGEEVDRAIVVEFTPAKPALRVELIGLLASRRAASSVPTLLTAASDADSAVRAAAVTAIGTLAGPDDVAAMIKILLAADKGPAREAVEKAVMLACARIDDPAKRAEPVLAAVAKLGEPQKTILLSTLGRVGGPAALTIIEAAIADSNPARREAGIRALGNWPDSSVAPKLLELANRAAEPGSRTLALKGLIRVAPLRDGRPTAEKLAFLKTAMTMATLDDDCNTILKRSSAIRTMDSLHFILGYLDQPQFAQQVCESIVELAHHRELREPNKDEFDKALDAAIRVSKDPTVIDKARRYKKGQT